MKPQTSEFLYTLLRMALLGVRWTFIIAVTLFCLWAIFAVEPGVGWRLPPY